ncbi:hypothetical protein VNO78_31347 [Psophocarpus tetragonolobus]|uniref:Epidermal patterning factor-like protein n=1 Tax=Psophocarpus tetragonolobus TaxID=3891 RepID=A0AAN9RY79_PSOTE
MSTVTAYFIPCADDSCTLSAKTDIDVQERGENGQSLVSKRKTKVSSMGLPRRVLGEVGSEPPNCNSKCDECSPCEPCLNTVSSRPNGYYPLAWMCKCGDKCYQS